MFTISHSPYTGSTVADGTQGPLQHGSAVSREIYGWYPGVGTSGAASSNLAGGDDYTLRVVASRTLLVPDASVYSPRDKVIFPGDGEADAFLVSKDVRDYNTGPYGYNPGGEVVVERTRG